MKTLRVCLIVLCVLVGLAAAGTGVHLALNHWSDFPVILQKPQQAEERAQALLDAVKDGRYEDAEGMFLETVDLGMERELDDTMSRALWQAYREHLAFTPVGELYPTKNGVARDYTVKYLDLEALLAPVDGRAKIIMEYRIENAQNVSELYDAYNEYREDLVADVLETAFNQLLDQRELPELEDKFTIELVYTDGQWKVLAQESLLRTITAGLTE